MNACPTCGRENPADARFCNGCGSRLGAVPSRREERKIVSVLFADLVGFTARAERLDPEDVRDVLAPYWRHLRDELERFGGTVEKFIGDAVMALFGAPTAHEDDAERAVRAALAIRDWAREEPGLQVRIAVNTGEALVLLSSKPAEGEGMAAGDVVNTAARLQTAAPVNGVLVGEATYRATRHVVDYIEREAVAVKGKSEPLAVWEAVGARSRVSVEEMSAAPLAGREHELELLVNALQRSRRECEPQLVTVAGVPGIGKSRLVAELFAFVEAEPDLIAWRRGRSLAYGDGVSLWALGEIAKAELGVLESDAREETEAKLGASLDELVADAGERSWLERHLAPLLGLPAPTVERSERFGAWRRWIELLAERRPLVLVFEDLQWADDDLLDFVDELADWAAGIALLVVCTTRPELFERRPGWGGGKRNALTVSLGPLTDAETARIVAATLDRALLPAETQAAVLERAAGNPLYAEQFARMIVEGARLDELPETVQGIVAARLDLLAPDEKALLQRAAVVGRAFWPGAVDAADELLRSLVRKEFVRRERRSSVADEQEYTFAHALVRDVAYAQIPRAERGAEHRRAAEWIETLPADRAVDRAEMLAHHYAAALELVGTAHLVTDDLRGRARNAFRDAGARALALHAVAAASRHYAAALELTAADDPERPELLLELGAALAFHDPPAALAPLAEAAAAFSLRGDRERAARADVEYSHAAWYCGHRREADERAERAVELLAGEPASEAKAEALAHHARLLMLAGELSRSVEVASAAIELARELGSELLEAAALATRGTALGRHGGDDLRRGIALAERAKAVFALQRGLNNLAEHEIARGDLQAGLEQLRRYRALADQLGIRSTQTWIAAQEASHQVMTGEWDLALAHADALIEASDAGSPTYLDGSVRSVRARIRQARGDAAGALDDVLKGIASAREAMDAQMLVPTLAAAAEVFAHERHVAEARAALAEILQICRSLERVYWAFSVMLVWPVLDLEVSAAFADVFEPFRDDDVWTATAVKAWRGDVLGAADAFGRFGARALEAEARVRAAAQLRASGDTTRADAQLRRALAFFREVGATRRIRDAETLLAATA